MKKTLWTALLLSTLTAAGSSPVSISGFFNSSYDYIHFYRHTTNDTNPAFGNNSSSTTETGEFIAPSTLGMKSASFHTHLLKLQPQVLVNDAASFFSEVTVGYGNSKHWGEDSEVKKAGSNQSNAPLYLQNSMRSTLYLTKMYMELYADTATWIIGRAPMHYGLGAIFNEGKNPTDRFSSIHDGVSANIKLGNFLFTPFWYIASSDGNASNPGELTSARSTKFYGLTFLYDNFKRSLALGIHLSWKKSSPASVFYQGARTSDDELYSNVTNGVGLGGTNVKITDFYFKKAFGPFEFQVEIPLIRGDIGHALSSSANSKYKGLGVIAESTYTINDQWNAGVDFGHVTGESGDSGNFDALFLHPNYQVANLMFRHNLSAISDKTNNSVFDSYIHNTRYLKLHGQYDLGNWIWDFAFIYAKAHKTARAGQMSYDHNRNILYPSAASQSDKMGSEIDVNFTYKWNPSVDVNGGFGQWFVGDYYAFTGSTPQAHKNPYSLHFNVTLKF